MLKITFRFMLHSHELADGTHKIILRITQERKHKYVDIGYSVKAADWNNEKKEVRKTNPLWCEIKMVMDSKLLEAQKTYLNARAQDATTLGGRSLQVQPPNKQSDCNTANHPLCGVYRRETPY